MKEYESPKAFKLDEAETLSVFGSCDQDGSSADSCSTGVDADGACAGDGQSAGRPCNNLGNEEGQRWQ